MSSVYLNLVRRLKLWVIVLAILNITIISTIGVNMYLAHKKEVIANKSVEGINNFFVNYLALSDFQKQQFDSIIIDYNNSLKEVGIRLRDVKERLNVKQVEQDTLVMNKIYEDFICAQSLNRDLTIKFYDNVRAICNSNQVAKFNEVIFKTAIPVEAQTNP